MNWLSYHDYVGGDDDDDDNWRDGGQRPHVHLVIFLWQLCNAHCISLPEKLYSCNKKNDFLLKPIDMFSSLAAEKVENNWIYNDYGSVVRDLFLFWKTFTWGEMQ